jgi:hypothetical protein
MTVSLPTFGFESPPFWLSPDQQAEITQWSVFGQSFCLGFGCVDVSRRLSNCITVKKLRLPCW